MADSVVRRKKGAKEESDSSDIATVIEMLKEAKKERERLEGDFNKSFNFVHQKIDDQKVMLENYCAKVDKYIEIIERVMQENIQLKDRVALLEKRLDDSEQVSRSNILEIQGIPPVPNENVLEIIKKVGSALDVQIGDEMVDTCYRVRKKDLTSKQTATIVVKFVRKAIKDEVMRMRRVKRTFSTRHLGLADDTPVYINESLSSGRRRLFAKARELKKSRGFKYLWIRDGKILMRKKENDPVIHINSVDDILKL